MLTFLFSQFSSLQIFKSIFFRAGMGYLTTYFMVSWLLPWMIKRFKEKRLVSDFSSPEQKQQAVPIMGGALLIFASLISISLWGWVWQTPHIILLCATMVGFGLIGFFDDLAKVAYKKKVDAGLIDRKNFLQKAEGLSENSRWLLEFAFTFVMLGIFFFAFQYIDTRIQIPFFPVKNFFPELPVWLYYVFAAALVVIGANSINMTDGLDSLATVPMLTCLLFVAAIAYISGDLEWSTKLKIPYLSNEIKEIAVWACVIMGGLMAFLKYNCPPASIYMGDVGSLGIGAALVTSFIFVKAEIYLSIAGGIFFIAGLSSLIQRVFFKFAMKKHGRTYAEQNRFFYRAPYHHHKQATYNSEGLQINSVYQKFVNRLGWLGGKGSVDKPLTKDGINSKIVWHNLIKAIWLLVLALIIFFKMR